MSLDGKMTQPSFASQLERLVFVKQHLSKDVCRDVNQHRKEH
jgi:hypothetical protein